MSEETKTVVIGDLFRISTKLLKFTNTSPNQESLVVKLWKVEEDKDGVLTLFVRSVDPEPVVYLTSFPPTPAGEEVVLPQVVEHEG